MDKLIKPLSDFLKTYPDVSATVIILLSAIVTFLGGMYVVVEQREKKQLKEAIEFEKTKIKGNEEDRKRLEDQEKKIRLVIEELKENQKNLDKLERENLSLEVNLKVTEGQELLRKMISASQSGIQDIEQAVFQKENRRAAVKAKLAKQSQHRNRKPYSLRNIIDRFTGRYR